MTNLRLLISLGGLCLHHLVSAQCPDASFSSPPTACLDQQLSFEPNGVYSRYEWDFCSGDLEEVPSSSVLLNSATTSYGHGVELVEQNGTYYGFFTSRESGRLFRMDFGSSPENTPAVVNLGGLGVNSVTWRTIRIVKEGSNYIGFIIDLTALYRIQFGSSLTNAPSSAEAILTGTPLNNSQDLAVLVDAGRYLYATSHDRIIRIKFPLSFGDPAGSLVTAEVPVAGALLIAGLSFSKFCDTHFALVSSILNSKVLRLAFSGGPEDNSPVVDELTTLGFTPLAPASVSLAAEGGKYYGFVQSNEPTGNLYRIDFGTSPANVPSGSNLGNVTSGGILWGFSLHRYGSRWLAFASENSGSKMFRLMFPNSCLSETEFSDEPVAVVRTDGPGIYGITLSVYDGAGRIAHHSKSLSVSSATAPDIAIQAAGVCAGSVTQFDPVNNSGDLLTYAWDFGDGNTSALASPPHIYGSPGNFQAGLEVTSAGCTNLALYPIDVFTPPAPDFNLPAIPVPCTNQPYTLTNTSAYDPASNPAWLWRVNGLDASTAQSPALTFTAPGDQVIELVASIPGCSSSLQKVLTGLQVGPEVDFDSPPSGCVSSNIQFTNTTSGSVLGFVWDFGDGSSSTEVNPSHPYSTIGTRAVTLTAINAAGCENFATRLLPVYSTPQPAFQLALPPFSCSGSPSQFTDLTPNPPDSNLSAWSWNFGDPTTTTDISTDRNSAYTYAATGSYDVTLAVTSNYGCTGSVVQTVVISPSPSAAFTHSPSCLGQSTSFDGPSAGVVQWDWNVENSAYTVADPVHVFFAAGDAVVRLTTTGSNGCQSISEKILPVPLPPVMDLEAIYPCTSQLTEYTDRSTPPLDDPFIQWSWKVGDTAPAGGNPLVVTHSSPGTFPVELTVTAQSGCTYTYVEDVSIASAPLAYFTATPDEGTNPLPVQFSASTEGVTDWTWNFDDGTAVQPGPSLTHTYQGLGEYAASLTVTDARECTNSMTRVIRVIIPQPDARIVDFYLAESTSGFSTPVAVIENKGNTTLSSLTVQLIMDGLSQIQGIVPQAISPGQQLNFAFSLSIPDLMTDQYVCTEVLVTSDINPLDNRACVSGGDELDLLSVGPSPADDHVLIDWTTEGDQAELFVSDLRGALIFSRVVSPGKAGLYRLRLDVAHLSSGLYVVHLRSGNRRESVRFIINH